MDVRIARVIGENYAHSLQQTHCVLIFPSDKTGKSERASGSGKEKPAAARQWRRRRRWQRASMCARAHRTDCVCMCVCVWITHDHTGALACAFTICARLTGLLLAARRTCRHMPHLLTNKGFNILLGGAHTAFSRIQPYLKALLTVPFCPRIVR